MDRKCRFITDDELRARYGEQGLKYFVFPNDCGCEMVKIHLCRDKSARLDVIFSRRLPISGNTVIDPLRPMSGSLAEYNQNDYHVKAGSLTGAYLQDAHEFHLTSNCPRNLLRIFEVSRTDGKEVSPICKDQLIVNNGELEFYITVLNDDMKTMTVYAMAKATGNLEVLTIRLEV